MKRYLCMWLAASVFVTAQQALPEHSSCFPYQKPVVGAIDVSVHDSITAIICMPYNKAKTYGIKNKRIGVVVSDELHLSRRDVRDLEKLLEGYIGSSLKESDLKVIRQKVITYYREIHRPIVVVTIPEQDITEGVLSVEIMEARLSCVSISGEKWFSKETYEKLVRPVPGDIVRSDVVANDIAWINRNPFRSADVVFSPGDSIGETNMEVIVRDKRPFRFFIGSDNSGFRHTQFERLFIGFNWGNVLGLGNVLSYQFNASPNFKAFISHSFHFTAFLPWRHYFLLFGGHATVRPKLTPDLSPHESKGESMQVSGRYEVPMQPGADKLHRFRMGVDYKRTNNTILFGGDTIDSSSINIFQIMMGYNSALDGLGYNTFFELEFFFSPGQTFPHMNEQQYTDLRRKSQSLYGYGRLGMKHLQFFKNRMELLLRVEGQASATTVPATESAYLGGRDSVRGYEEREIQLDNAMTVTIEGHTPPISIVKRDKLVFIAFFDIGYGGNYYRDNGDDLTHKFQKLASVGPGFCYNVGESFVAKADLGFQLIKPQGQSKLKRRVDYSVTYTY